jgi:uncharacterized protein YndB with AHSA1/START domain
MANEFEVQWEGELPATPPDVWDAFTMHTAGWYWKIEYEPRVGGAERGLTSGGGTVTAWDPPRHFATRAERDGDGFNQLDYLLEPRGAGTHLRYVHCGVIAEITTGQLEACPLGVGSCKPAFGGRVRMQAPTPVGAPAIPSRRHESPCVTCARRPVSRSRQRPGAENRASAVLTGALVRPGRLRQEPAAAASAHSAFT